ncbi:MAG: ExbD/TolR family protein [Prevotella sp.]
MRLSHHPHRHVPELNTSALPDLIFTVLFFFMLVTHMRQTDATLHILPPDGTNLQKTERRHTVSYLYIGTDASGDIKLLFGDKAVTPASIPYHVNRDREMLPPDEQTDYTVSVKADRSVPLHIISDVKTALREAGVSHINYSATENIKKP